MRSIKDQLSSSIHKGFSGQANFIQKPLKSSMHMWVFGKFKIFLIVGLIVFGSVAASTSISDHNRYRTFCLSAAKDAKVFSNFKRNPAYAEILEHVSRGEGQAYLDYIFKYYPHLFQDFKKFQANDLLGSPIVFNYPEVGIFGPTTLRYVKVLGDLESIIGDLNSKKIIEIGGGYGGQCLIISKAYDFDKYYIVDLPEPLMLTEKYLRSHKVSNVQYLNAFDITPQQDSYDLVLSNFAFSECIRSVQLEYLEKIIKHAKHGYFTLNFLDSAASSGRMTVEELMSILTSYGFNPRITPEVPAYAPGGLILTW